MNFLKWAKVLQTRFAMASSCLINVMDVDCFSAARSKYILAECIHRMSFQKHPAQLNLKQGEPERKPVKAKENVSVGPSGAVSQGRVPHTVVMANDAMGELKNYLKVLEQVYAESPTQLIIYLHASSVSYLGNTNII